MRAAGAVRSLPPVLLERCAYLPIIALSVAIWPVWRWLITRAIHDASDAWALLSLATALAMLWRDRAQLQFQRARWGVPIMLVLVYATTYPLMPPLGRALVAMSAITAACSSQWYGRRMDAPLWGLFLLALPLVPSMNFYLGYPLRVMVGEATSILLHLNGFAASREGTTLLWNGQQVSIDAPCSGVKMLWTGMYLSCTLAALWRMDARRAMSLGAFAMLIVITANVLRATALFYVESGVVPQAQPAHAPIGVVTFVLAAIAIAAVAARLRLVTHAS
jgi:exosortase/archaeosortase family protein